MSSPEAIIELALRSARMMRALIRLFRPRYNGTYYAHIDGAVAAISAARDGVRSAEEWADGLRDLYWQLVTSYNREPLEELGESDIAAIEYLRRYSTPKRYQSSRLFCLQIESAVDLAGMSLAASVELVEAKQRADEVAAREHLEQALQRSGTALRTLGVSAYGIASERFSSEGLAMKNIDDLLPPIAPDVATAVRRLKTCVNLTALGSGALPISISTGLLRRYPRRPFAIVADSFGDPLAIHQNALTVQRDSRSTAIVWTEGAYDRAIDWPRPWNPRTLVLSSGAQLVFVRDDIPSDRVLLCITESLAHPHRPDPVGPNPMKRVFISYSHKDATFVRALQDFLRRSGVGVWIDRSELKVGESLTMTLREAIDSVDYVVAVISSHSCRSEWVLRELDIAVNQELARSRTRVLPVLKDACALPGFLEGKVFADFTRPSRRRQAREMLLEAILAPQSDDETTT